MKSIFISNISWSYIFSYFRKTDSLFRHYQDLVLQDVSDAFSGEIIELGGEKHYSNQRFFKKNNLIVSNITRDYDLYLDVTKIQLESNSVDNFLMISMLQHVDKPFDAMGEVTRTLKQDGRLLIINAFMHPICDDKDYWRFGVDAYHTFFGDDYEIEKVFYLGGKFSMLSNTLRRPIGGLSPKQFLEKCFGLLASIIGYFFDRQDNSPIAIGMLVRKK